MKLVTHNLSCNLHQAAIWINDYNLADKVLMMDCLRGEFTVIVFRVENDFDLDAYFNIRARDIANAKKGKL